MYPRLQEVLALAEFAERVKKKVSGKKNMILSHREEPLDFMAKNLLLCLLILAEKCLDNDIMCEELKGRGYCEQEDRKKYMSYHCKRTCKLCYRKEGEPLRSNTRN